MTDTDLVANLVALDQAITDLIDDRRRIEAAVEAINATRPPTRADWEPDECDPEHIWLNAFSCFRPTPEFAAQVGAEIIRRAMQHHPKRVTITVNAS